VTLPTGWPVGPGPAGRQRSGCRRRNGWGKALRGGAAVAVAREARARSQLGDGSVGACKLCQIASFSIKRYKRNAKNDILIAEYFFLILEVFTTSNFLSMYISF